MKFKDFLTEQWMNDYEHQAIFNLTDTSAEAHTFDELLALEPDALQDLVLDYGMIVGDDALRKEILSLYQDNREETLTTCHGALQGNEMVMSILLEPGDHVIALKPGYQQFYDFPAWLGCSVSTLELEEADWSFNLEKFERMIRTETRLFVFANPSNPTGTWLDFDQLQKLVSVCREHGIWILCDEVYRMPSKEDISITDLYEKGVATGSLAKTFGLPGLRFGWIKGSPDLIHDINVARDYTIISTGPLKEKLAWIALKHKERFVAETMAIVEGNKKTIQKWLQTTPHFSCVIPRKGTVCFLKYYASIPSAKLAKRLLDEEGIFFVPGSCFEKEGYLRLGLGRKHQDLRQVLDRLDIFMDQLKENR